MKNLINSVNGGRQRKLSISGNSKVSRSNVHDSLVDELNISLKGFDFFGYNDAERVVYDCNINNVTVHGRSKVRSYRSWNKRRKARSDSILKSDEDITVSSKTYLDRKEQPGESIDVFEVSTSCKLENPRRTISLESPKELYLRNSKKEIYSRHLRRFSTSRRDSDLEDSRFDVIDFGSCHSPNEMKAWALVDKLTTWGNNHKNITQRKTFSFSEPAKRFLSQSLPGSLRRRKKSYECQKKTKENEIIDITLDESGEEAPQDFSLTREVIDYNFITDADVSFSSNVWYYGELDIKYMYRKTSGCKITQENSKIIGSLLVRIDKYGDVIYSLTYHIENNLCVGAFPYEYGKYCLDFSDPDQPRFSSVKFLIAHLIEQKYLQRVTFSWLVENSIS